MTRITHRLINFLVRFVILIGNLLEVLRRGGRNDMLYGCVKITSTTMKTKIRS